MHNPPRPSEHLRVDDTDGSLQGATPHTMGENFPEESGDLAAESSTLISAAFVPQSNSENLTIPACLLVCKYRRWTFRCCASE